MTKREPSLPQNREEFLKKWGNEGWQLPIMEFIRRAPSFPGEEKLAEIIGELISDIENALLRPNNQ